MPDSVRVAVIVLVLGGVFLLGVALIVYGIRAMLLTPKGRRDRRDLRRSGYLDHDRPWPRR